MSNPQILDNSGRPIRSNREWRELAETAETTIERVRAERDAVARQGERDRIASISYQNQLAAMTADRDEWKRMYTALHNTSGQLEELLITIRAAKDRAVEALKEAAEGFETLARMDECLFGQHPKLAFKHRATGPQAPEVQKQWLARIIAELEAVK